MLVMSITFSCASALQSQSHLTPLIVE